MAKISVIIPCYNVSAYLSRCMESIKDQTIGIDDLEVILVNDASTDDTWDVINEWEKKLPEQVMAISYDENGRQGKARNVGLSYASAPYVAFIDSDDYVERDYLERLYDATLEYDADVAYCSLVRDTSKELSYNDKPSSGKVRFLNIDSEDKRRGFIFGADISFPAHSKLIKRSVLLSNDLRFPEGLAYEDCCWGSLLYYYVDRVCYIDDPLYHYFVNTDSTVMKKSADYHTDMLTVHMILWNEYLSRGLYPKYKDEIEFNYIYTCYLGFLKILANRYEGVNYSHFMLLKELVNEKIPNFRENRYIKQGAIKDFHLALLETLETYVDRNSLSSVLDAIRRSGM